jgi:hypothetical protein
MPTAAIWRKYVIEPDNDNRALLEDWRWLLANRNQLLFYNLFGDAFLTDTDDRLLILDVGFGQLVDTQYKASNIELLICQQDKREQWLQCALVDHLQQLGEPLSKHECYGFSTRPPILGGKYEPDNLKPVLLEVHHTLLSQLHQHLHDLPDEATIDAIEIAVEGA